MFLYSLTLQPTTRVHLAVYGNFSGAKAQEIIISKGKILELLRPDDAGRVQTVLSVEVFGEIRALLPVRLTGGQKDYIVVGSDSGRIIILEYIADGNRFVKVHEETFGKSGCRRIVPGQYVAADAKGRAVMIAAVEKQKLVYVLNRDAAAKLTISSPLEAHKSHTIVWDVVGLDVGFENPVFACLEIDYEASNDADGEKQLVFYELDLGLNHVVRKLADAVDVTANKLIAVPGDKDGPGGVLICAENVIYFKNQGHAELRAVLPRRESEPLDRPLLIVASATHKQKDMFFVLIQTEHGDVYKVTLAYTNDTVQRIDVHYFHTLPVACALAVIKTGFLFVARQFGGQMLYQFQGIGAANENMYTQATHNNVHYRLFKPQEMPNLTRIFTADSLCPTIGCKALDLANEGSPQLYALGGVGPTAALRVLRHGLAVDEVAVAPLEANPNAVWTVKRHISDPHDSYLVVSFVNATLVLSIGGESVEEVSDSGLLGTAPTLMVALIGDDALLQAHAGGLRHVRADKRGQEWKTPGRKQLQHAACNGQQAVVAVSGGELFYFELDALGQLREVQKHDFGKEVAALALAPLTGDAARARFVAVADFENSVQLFSLAPTSLFGALSSQSVPAQVSSLCIVEMGARGAVSASGAQLYLNIGLQNGVLLRTVLDGLSGELSDTRTRFVGTRPVRLEPVRVGGERGLLALSSRTWLCYNWQSRYQMTPLSYMPLAHAAAFSSEQCPSGIVAVAENTVRIVAFDRLGEMFNVSSIPLRYTPRKFVVHPLTNNLIVIESEHNSEAYSARAARALAGTNGSATGDGAGATTQRRAAAAAAAAPPPTSKTGKRTHANADDDDDDADGAEEGHTLPDAVSSDNAAFNSESAQAHEREYGRPPAGTGRWASCIRVLDAVNARTHSLLELTDDECAVSLALVTFAGRADELLLLVGVARGMTVTPRAAKQSFLHTYRFGDGGKSLVLLHRTPLDAIPGALAAFDGRLLAGVGATLRIYDLGKKKLLRKCENRSLPTFITSLDVSGSRVIVGDLAQSFMFVTFKKLENQFHVFADDPAPRHLTAQCRVDYDTVAGGDKFGNAFVLRLPTSVASAVEDDPTGGRHRWEQGSLNAAAHKAEAVVQFHVGELVTSIERTPLVPGGADVLLYTTIGGAVGAFVPFISREDIDFFMHLEMHMRQHSVPLCGRDHMAYRSAYFPVKGCIDGDLCEQYFSLDVVKQKAIADELARTPNDVLKRLDDMRHTRLL